MKNSFNKLPDLGDHSRKFFAAVLGEEKRKEDRIKELQGEYMRRGFSLWMAERLAQEQYNVIHKNKTNE